MAEQAADAGQAAAGSRVPRITGAGPLQLIAGVVGLAWQTVVAAAGEGIPVRQLVDQMAAVGADSIWIVLIITGATGAVFAYYVTQLSQQVGVSQLVGGTLAYGLFNELGPVLSGVALAARAGAAIAAELATMVVTEQVDAMRSMAVSPVRYLVAPRIAAALIMLPLLTAIADCAGLYGGYLFARMAGITGPVFFESVRTWAHTVDLERGLIKAVVFGAITGLIACHQGLSTRRGATGVGRATTGSVVLCVISIFLADLALTPFLRHLALR
ncbi:MAG: ABC transporter permease [Armatimonadetes bacterium]|nr:ABC transporter permease [Armatimonadota bacterium]MDE2208056.1 ABC transporter permease [Armatimonadota bacterium]